MRLLMPTSRRQFISTSGIAVLGAITSRKGLSFSSTEQSIQVLPDESIGTIRPELHGQFAEHLGSCTYGGLWVGRESPIPNINGYRKQSVEYLKALAIPVLRWPGGCFADDYHWREGIGPAEKRPKIVNIHWGKYIEDNSFGTYEFVGLCRLIGAQPYFAGNMGSGTPEELRDWMEYCNYPGGSTLSDERIRNGAREPFGIKYWGVGNENWGCGGNMTPEYYVDLYHRFATFLTSFGDTQPFLVACGPSKNDLDWTKRIFEALRKRRMPNGYTMHFYSNGKDEATHFTVDHMNDQFASFQKLEEAIGQQRALMDQFDPNRQIGFIVDEWGVWDRMNPQDEKQYGRLWQQITIRAAVATALGLNVFNRQADKLVMCNIAQTVNVLDSILLTRGDQCIRTPTYFAFELMKPHLSKTAVKTEGANAGPLDLSVSASTQGDKAVVTVVNPKAEQPVRVNLSIAGKQISSARGRMMHNPDLNACNTFESPNTVAPQDLAVSVSGRGATVEVPPLGIVTIEAQTV